MKLDQEKEEAQRLAKLNEEEKMQHELNKQKQAFEDERKQFLRERKEHETTLELSNLGLPILFAKYLIDESDEVTNANIKKLKKSFQNQLKKRSLKDFKVLHQKVQPIKMEQLSLKSNLRKCLLLKKLNCTVRIKNCTHN